MQFTIVGCIEVFVFVEGIFYDVYFVYGFASFVVVFVVVIVVMAVTNHCCCSLVDCCTLDSGFGSDCSLLHCIPGIPEH